MSAPPEPEDPATPRRRGALLTRLLLVLVGTAAGLGVAELAARSAFPGADAFYLYPPDLKRVFLPTVKILPGIGERSRFETNSLGLRGDEPPAGEAYRILAVGGSTTQCAFVDQPESWPVRLNDLLAANEAGLPVWVINAGRSGFTSRRHVIQLRHLLEQGDGNGNDFDAVLLLAGVNDLANRLEYGDEEPPLEDLTWQGVKTAKCFTHVPPEYDDLHPVLGRLGLFRMFKALELRSSMPAEERVGNNYKLWRRNRRSASRMVDTLPDLERALEAYRTNLVECAEIAREHGARLVLIDQPSIWRADLPETAHKILWLGGIGDYQHEEGLPYYSIEALAEGMRLYNETLHQVAAEAGLESIRLAEQLPRDPLHFYDDVHFNTQGSIKVAEVIAKQLLETPPFSAGTGAPAVGGE